MDNSAKINGDTADKRSQLEPNVLIVRMLEQTKQQDDQNAKDIRIKNINRYLKSTQDYRSLGLIALADFLELHSVNATSFVSEKECQELDWIETVLRFLDQKSESPERCFPIINKLLTITGQNDEMRKIVQSKFVRKVVECITSWPQSISTLQCLATLLREYSGPSGIFKNQIYDYCTAIVDEINFELVHNAGICLNLLQQTRGGEIGGSGHQRNWGEFHEKLLNSLEELFVMLLNTGEDIKVGKSEKLKLNEFKKQKDVPLIYTHQERFIRFKNVCIILEATLTQAFPAPKAIQLSRIISFVNKRVALNQAQRSRKDGESHVPHILHIEIEKSLLSLLNATIVAVNSNILPHSKDVCDILWKCLKSTNTAYDEFKISGTLSLRTAVYDALIKFLKVSPNNHYVYKYSENFMKEALLDITPLQTEVVLTIPNASSKPKKKRGGVDTKRTLTKGLVDNCLKLHQEICSKSLEFLSNFVTYNGAAMKPVLYKILQDKILATSFKTLSRNLSKQDLYDSNECRMKLLELNFNLVTHSSSRNVTPMSFFIEVFGRFKDCDRDPRVRQRSFELLKNVESILHSRKDPIHFPTDLRDFRDTWLFNEKIVKSFEQIDIEKYQQYGKVYQPTSNGSSETELKCVEKRSSEEKPKEADEKRDEQTIDISSEGEDETEKEQPTKVASEESDDDDVESEEDVEMVEKIAELPAKRRSTAKISESPPKKVARAKSEASTVQNKNEEDIVNSYLEDFCGDTS